MARSLDWQEKFVDITLTSLVQAHASRQVISAAVATLWRLQRESSLAAFHIGVKVEERLSP
eukprot:2276164-Prorocentrum_lima.AAC.1